MTTFKERLLEIMKQRDMSQVSVAKKLNVNTAPPICHALSTSRHILYIEKKVCSQWLHGIY